MTDLASRLKSAPHGSRELSNEVLLACKWMRHRIGEEDLRLWWSKGPRDKPIPDGQQPSPTESVDDALALLAQEPGGYGWRGHLSWPGYNEGLLKAKAKVRLHHMVSSGGNYLEAYGATPALALSAALIEAATLSPPAP